MMLGKYEIPTPTELAILENLPRSEMNAIFSFRHSHLEPVGLVIETALWQTGLGWTVKKQGWDVLKNKKSRGCR